RTAKTRRITLADAAGPGGVVSRATRAVEANRGRTASGAGNRPCGNTRAATRTDVVFTAPRILPRKVQHQADLANVGIPAIADQRREGGRDHTGQAGIAGLGSGRHGEALEIEWPAQPDIDQARHAAFDIV